MTKDQFNLTVWPGDLREIYHAKLNYRFFSNDNNPTIMHAGLFLLFSVICIVKSFSDTTYQFFALSFIALLGYQVTLLFKNYWQFKKSKAEIQDWIDDLKKYKVHKIIVGDGDFKYIRDNDLYVYNLKNVKKTYRTNDHFYFVTMDNMDIILPQKAFEKGEYAMFTAAFDESVKRSLQ